MQTKPNSFLPLTTILLLTQLITSPRLTCNTQLLRSFTFHSRIIPNRINAACPNIAYNCCTVHDQMQMHKMWTEHTNPHINNHHKQSMESFKKLKPVYFLKKQMDIRGLIAEYEADPETKKNMETLNHVNELMDEFYKLDWEELTDEYEKTLKRMEEMLHHIKHIRKGFLCTLCEFQNHKYFNTNIHNLVYKQSFCKEIVDKFLKTLQIVHQKYFRYLLVLDELVYMITDVHLMENEKDRAIFKRNNLVVTKCVNSPGDITQCFDLCKLFNLNRFDYIFDGATKTFTDYMEKFSDFMEQLIGVKVDHIKLVQMGKKKWKEEEIKSLRKTGSVFSKKILKDPTIKRLKKNSFGLQFKTPKVINFVERKHQFGSMQLENLDSVLEPIALFKLAENPIDITQFQILFNLHTGIDLIRDSRKVNLDHDKEKLFGLIHAKAGDVSSLSEVLDDGVQTLLKQMKITDFSDFYVDHGMHFKMMKFLPEEAGSSEGSGKVERMLSSVSVLKAVGMITVFGVLFN